MSVEREMSLAEWCAKLPSLHLVNQELSTLTKQLAALAEQNEKLHEALITISIAWSSNEIYSQHFFNAALAAIDALEGITVVKYDPNGTTTEFTPCKLDIKA